MKITDFIRIQDHRGLLLLLAVACAGLLAVALIGQYGFDLHPCHLCIYQRIPYATIVTIGVVAFFLKKRPNLLCYAAWVCLLLLLTDVGIAFYHAGVELEWFPGLSGCSNDTTGAPQTLEEMRRAIMEAPLVTCDQAMIHVLGLSMAAWNSIAAFTLAIFTVVGLNRLKEKA